MICYIVVASLLRSALERGEPKRTDSRPVFYFTFTLQVFIAISLILGDGIYNLVKIIAITVKEICNKSSKNNNIHVAKGVLGEYMFVSDL